MNASQEEALYDFLDNAVVSFDLDEIISFIRRIDPRRMNRLAADVEAYINSRKLAFQSGVKRWVSRRGCFEPLAFVVSPAKLELVNGILIPGHRCVPFANSSLLPQEYTFFWQGSPIPFTTTEGPPEEFYPFYSIYGEEYAPQYVARDNFENEEAFNSDPYDDPPEVSIKTLDMRNIYRETSFIPGDRFIVRTMDWRVGKFKLEKVSKDDWLAEDLDSWCEAAENGFEASFNNLGPASCTEEQVAYAYWYGGPRMRNIPAYSLEDFLYKKTNRIEIEAYGIETRFWFAGREIPDRNELDTSDARPDKTPIEDILYKMKIPVSEFVIQSYIRDSLFREEKDVRPVMERLIPASTDVDNRDRRFLTDYVESIQEEFHEFYTPFADKEMGPIRQRAGELHTAVIDLAAMLCKGDIDISWLPRHTFIILSQIQSHTASVLEDLDSDDPPPAPELEALDNSLDSMIETYEDIKELIEKSMNSFRRNKLVVVRSGNKSGNSTEWLVQLSIGGIDVWRRIILSESSTLGELHRIIQAVFGWNNSQSFKFNSEKIPGESGKSEEKELDKNLSIKDLEKQNIIELLYEYGTKWTVRIMVLSRYESPVSKPIRCVAGAGAAPPEYIGGPLKFRRLLSALISGNDLERLGARQELGTEFFPGEFDLESCNRLLNTVFYLKGPDPGRQET